MSGLLGRELGSYVEGRSGCLEDLRPIEASLLSTPLLIRLESDRTESVGEGGVKSGSGISGTITRQ